MRKKGGPPQREWKTSEIMYLARFYEHDGLFSMASSLDRSAAMTFNMYQRLKDDGTLEFWQMKWDEMNGWR